jgi:hypothetical protein
MLPLATCPSRAARGVREAAFEAMLELLPIDKVRENDVEEGSKSWARLLDAIARERDLGARGQCARILSETLLRKRRAGALPWRNARVFRGLVALFVGELDGELAFHWLRCFWALLPESTYVKQRNPVFATARRVNLSLEELTKKANQASSGLDGRQLTFL